MLCLTATSSTRSSILTALASVLRGLPLLVSARPKTPLRVLCIIAFDTLHQFRHARRLPWAKLQTLAALLDFGAYANAAFDDKDCCLQDCRTTLELLEQAGALSSVDEYLRRLADLEYSRPAHGGDQVRFQSVVLYREAVVRLSLGMIAATADSHFCLDDAIRETWGDADLNLLFRIVMQCQIIDDVLDYRQDVSAQLPSFLTASKSPAQALELTRLAALRYADDRDLPPAADLVPLRWALRLVSTCARLTLFLGRFRRPARGRGPVQRR